MRCIKKSPFDSRMDIANLYIDVILSETHSLKEIERFRGEVERQLMLTIGFDPTAAGRAIRTEARQRMNHACGIASDRAQLVF